MEPNLIVDFELDGKLLEITQPVDGLTKAVLDEYQDWIEDLEAENKDLTKRIDNSYMFLLTDAVEMTIFGVMSHLVAKYRTEMSLEKRLLYAELAQICKDISLTK